MDILRVLSTPDLEVRKKTLQLALDLVSSRNVEEVKYILLLFRHTVFLFFGKIWDCLQFYLIFSAACDCPEEGSD